MKKIALLIMLVICMNLLFAEWASDSGVNLRVTNSTNEEVIPKVAYGPNGDVWASWFSLENGNYNVRVQRYNFNGVAQFAPEGLLVSNHTQMSWLTDWDMKVDSQNNAVLSFLDVRNVNQDIFVYKISASGTFVWGADGIAVCTDETEDYTPTLGITDQNNVIVAWMAGDDMKMQKILANGTLASAQPILFHEEGYSHTWPQILPQTNDSFILKYAKDSGPFYSVLRKVYAQKYDSSFTSVWANPTTITDQGGISSWTQVFSTDSDGNGGFVICWYEDRDADQMRNVYVQHVLADGSVGFTANGIQPTTSIATQHFYPITAYDEISNETYMIWSETDADQNTRGLRVQKFNTQGAKMFGEDGLSIISLGDQSPLVYKADVVNHELVTLFTGALNGSTANSYMKAFKLNTQGAFVWEGDFVTMKGSNGGIVHEEATDFKSNQLVSIWEDTRAEQTHLYIQNLGFDGNLGVLEAQTGISGTVTLNGGEGIVTNVQIAIGDTIITPNANGSYYHDMPAGIYTVIATLADYYTVTVQNVHIDSAQVATLNITLEPETGSADNPINPASISLNNYPNPFNPSTTISFNLPKNDNVELSIFNVKGQKVKTLLNKSLSAGTHNIRWDGKTESGKSATSGIYYCRLTNSTTSIINKMLLIK